MSDKPKIGLYWCASCGGCEEAVVDLAENLLPVAELVDFAIWPVAIDRKKEDVEALPDRSIAATLINGAIRTSEQEEMVRLLRRKSELIVAFGACAQLGGIPALANAVNRDQILRYVYHDAPTVRNPEGAQPQTETVDEGRVAVLPEFREVVRSLDQVVEVDYSIPGCAPNPALLLQGLQAILTGELPPKGTVLAPDVAMCFTCPHIATKPADLEVPEYRRTHLHAIDPEVCLLAQGFPCLGPVTRGGCGERCVRANMPCTGCFGPTSRTRDFGAKALSAKS